MLTEGHYPTPTRFMSTSMPYFVKLGRHTSSRDPIDVTNTTFERYPALFRDPLASVCTSDLSNPDFTYLTTKSFNQTVHDIPNLLIFFPEGTPANVSSHPGTNRPLKFIGLLCLLYSLVFSETYQMSTLFVVRSSK